MNSERSLCVCVYTKPIQEDLIIFQRCNSPVQSCLYATLFSLETMSSNSAEIDPEAAYSRIRSLLGDSSDIHSSSFDAATFPEDYQTLVRAFVAR